MKSTMGTVMLGLTIGSTGAGATGARLDPSGLRGTYVGTDQDGKPCRVHVTRVQTLVDSPPGDIACRRLEVKLDGVRQAFKLDNQIAEMRSCGNIYAQIQVASLRRPVMNSVLLRAATEPGGRTKLLSITAVIFDLYGAFLPQNRVCENLSPRR